MPVPGKGSPGRVGEKRFSYRQIPALRFQVMAYATRIAVFFALIAFKREFHLPEVVD